MYDGRTYRGYRVQPSAQGPTPDQVAQGLNRLRYEKNQSTLQKLCPGIWGQLERMRDEILVFC